MVDINVSLKNKDTALIIAVKEKKEKMLDYLRHFKGINLNLADTMGNTALHYAVENGSEHTIMHILEKGPNPDIKNNEGKKPFDLINQKVANVYRLKLKEYTFRKHSRMASEDTTNTLNTPKTTIPFDLILPGTNQKGFASPSSVEISYRNKQGITRNIVQTLLHESLSEKYLASLESHREKRSQKVL